MLQRAGGGGVLPQKNEWGLHWWTKQNSYGCQECLNKIMAHNQRSGLSYSFNYYLVYLK